MKLNPGDQYETIKAVYPSANRFKVISVVACPDDDWVDFEVVGGSLDGNRVRSSMEEFRRRTTRRVESVRVV